MTSARRPLPSTSVKRRLAPQRSPASEPPGTSGEPGSRPPAPDRLQWRHLRTDARTAPWPTQVELIEAAYARPELREIYAFTSHWTLRLATVLPPERPVVSPGKASINTICPAASHKGVITVEDDFASPPLAETTIADEAVSIALSFAATGPAR